MEAPAARSQADGVLGRMVAFARRQPARALWWVLALHVLVWTLLPLLLNHNLQLDLAEDLALGKEWQLGYWKHPPLPWWTADLFYRVVGDVRVVYLLGPLSAAACFYAVWRLGVETVGPERALIAVLVLEGLHFYNFSVIKFAHDQMQLPFWAFTALFFYRAVARGRAWDWILAGIMLALAFWAKYAAFALAATLGLVLLVDPLARRTWRTAGPYLMAAAFLVVLGPNLWWLVTHDFMPFHYVDVRAKAASVWYEYLWFPVRWTGSQLFFLLPTIALLALLLKRGGDIREPAEPHLAFARRYVTALAFGPFVFTTLVAGLLGRLPVAMWGYPLWTFAPLAVLMWFECGWEPRRLRRFAAAMVVVFLAMPVVYAASELFESFLHDRAKATQFPGRQLAAEVTKAWRDKTGAALVYVAGTEFAANNIAVYSPDRPHVVVHANPALSPWVDMNDLRKRGVVLVWEQSVANQPMPAAWRTVFPNASVQPSLVLPRHTLYPGRPAMVGYAVIPPRP